MPVYRLTDDVVFPPVEFAEPGGLLAIGGDLSPERLLAAYRKGIFPWYSAGEPILWWAPDPRFVLFPEELHVSRSMKQFFKKGRVQITFDKEFEEVMSACGNSRPGQDGTWITAGMCAAYVRLHELGFAHSVEAWEGGMLVGGLYGVSLGRVFFGESMFSKTPNCSKAALITLVFFLRERGFDIIDCQVESKHLESLGARLVPREEFSLLLGDSLRQGTLSGNWGEFLADRVPA